MPRKKKQASASEECKLVVPVGGKSKKRRDNIDQISARESDCSGEAKNKLKRARKSKRKDRNSPKDMDNSVRSDEPYEIYEISSGDEDCSRGMKKWVDEYHTNRLDLEVLQQRIDDFIAEYEEQEEQARKDREAKIAEDGWTVVVHRKGGKKTSDPESGVVVGSVSQGAVLHNTDRKKSKETVGLDFYRFQRREAQRSEVMKLQSKFEEDKKRIQQLRAARKFKPY